MSETKSYITTPIYYVNGAPHIGHAYTSVAADILKRARQMDGSHVWLSTGVDEHGQKNEQVAAQSGLSPQAYLDLRAKEFRQLFDDLDVGYDYFVRTTAPFHIAGVVELEQRLFDRSLLVKREYSGLYCTGCEQFKRNADLDETGHCRDHPTLTPELSTEVNYFFPLEPYREALRRHLDAHPDWIRPASFANEVQSMLEQSLEDLCISRPKSRVTLGIELPFDSDYVTYVWFDALTNYITNVGWPEQRSEEWWPFAEHLIGKDILKTHCIYWPCMLLALGLPLPAISVHSHWVGPGGQKMSKTTGNAVDPREVMASFGVPALRYYFARHMRSASDSQISPELVEATHDAELGNRIGNLLTRIVKFAQSRLGGVVPDPRGMAQAESDLVKRCEILATSARAALAELDTIPVGAARLLEIADLLNDHLTKVAPWTSIKDPERTDEVGRVVYAVMDGLRMLLEAFWPISREISDRGLASLGRPPLSIPHVIEAGRLTAGAPLGEGVVLFPRRERAPVGA